MDSVEPVRILIVDDKADKAKALESIVSELGEVVCVNSGKDALRSLMSQVYAVILLDVNMPVMDGFETAEVIRKRETSERTPIIFITSYYDADTHRTRAYTLGAVDYILAPVIPEILKAKVSVFVDLFKKNEEVKLRADERVQLMQEQMARVAAEAARAAAEDSERRAAFLSNASRLLASSLDYEATLERVAQLTVPEVCDWCTVNIVTDDDQLQCLSIANVDPAKVAQAKMTTSKYLLNPADPVTTVIQTGVPELLNDVTKGSQSSDTFVEKHLSALGVSFMQSFMIVPLKARERTLGAMTFVTAESGRRLTQRDLALAEDLGRRAAVAIDNARLYKEAQLANRMKDDFLMVVSHELRTPLTPILGWTRMLRDDRVQASEKTHALDIIERNARAQAKLIEDLLDISRIITGKLRLSIKNVDLAFLIATSIDSLRPAADAKQINIQANMDAEDYTLAGDAERLQQVLWNLLSNAIKFTPNGGVIEVSASHTDGKTSVCVRDNGRGIDPKFLPYVFERFRQADTSTTRAFGGLGIGLAIVRHLVELHGGSVQAESPGEGLGAKFTVSFPVSDLQNGSAPSAPLTELRNTTQKKGSRLKGVQMLVVDDEPDTRELLARLFEQHGAIVIEASSAHEALEQLDRGKLDLLVSDIGMAGEDGYGLIRKIRNNAGQYAKIPAIALTAYAREEDAAAALLAGFHVHHPKPIDADALILSVEDLMRVPVN